VEVRDSGAMVRPGVVVTTSPVCSVFMWDVLTARAVPLQDS
jgi:hypothetical protein